MPKRIIPKATKRMADAHIRAGKLNDYQIRRLMASKGHNIAISTLSLRRKRLGMAPLGRQPYLERRFGAKKLRARLRKLTSRERVARWLELQNQKIALKARVAAIGPTRGYSPVIQKIRKERLLKQQSGLELELEILFPLLPKSFVDKLTDKEGDMFLAAGFRSNQ